MGLYCKPVLISEHLYFFIVIQKHFLEYLFLYLSKYGKKGHSQVSINCSSGYLIELNATELKGFTCGKPIFACLFIVMCLS